MRGGLTAMVWVGWGLACSENRAGIATTLGAATVAGAAGALGAAGSGTGAPGAGSSGGGAGAPPSPAPALRLGEPLELVAGTGELPYAFGPNPLGLAGSGFLARSPLGNELEIGSEPGQVCIRGNLEEVPGDNYGQYWGVEIGFNLTQEGAPGASARAPLPALRDASAAEAASSADAASAAPAAPPWLPSEVIGFSFVIEGPTIDRVRFKALPAGLDSALESSVFCKPIEATSGTTQTALFTEMTQYCWSSQVVPLPAASGLANMSWQLPADVAPAGARPFDWCLRDIRPILAP